MLIIGLAALIIAAIAAMALTGRAEVKIANAVLHEQVKCDVQIKDPLLAAPSIVSVQCSKAPEPTGYPCVGFVGSQAITDNVLRGFIDGGRLRTDQFDAGGRASIGWRCASKGAHKLLFQIVKNGVVKDEREVVT